MILPVEVGFARAASTLQDGLGRGRGPLHVESQRHGWHLSLYAPWLSPHREDRELGFMVRVRDPRGPCEHPRDLRDFTEAAALGRPVGRCGLCGALFDTGRKSFRRRRRPRWRWLKAYVGWTGRSAKGVGTCYVEVETHTTNGIADRVTVKTFVRFKVGVGGGGRTPRRATPRQLRRRA
jgi:hypothetical protein